MIIVIYLGFLVLKSEPLRRWPTAHLSWRRRRAYVSVTGMSSRPLNSVHIQQLTAELWDVMVRGVYVQWGGYEEWAMRYTMTDSFV